MLRPWLEGMGMLSSVLTSNERGAEGMTVGSALGESTSMGPRGVGQFRMEGSMVEVVADGESTFIGMVCWGGPQL